MQLHAITSRLRNERGQAAIEFALVLPLLIAFLFLIAGFARVFNTYNDLNQMAADGARFAAVGNFPGASRLLEDADTKLSQNATVDGPTYFTCDSSGSCSPSDCVVGGVVRVKVSASAELIPFLPYVPSVLELSPEGKAEMRVERCPS